MSIDTLKSLTKAQKEAIDFIGNHRKTDVRIGKHISVRMFNILQKKGLVMRLGKCCILTYPGERVWTLMHPHSKYAIK